MEEKKLLDISQTVKGAIQIGFKNAFTVLGTSLLWVITVWIPYLNIGTTIAFLNVLPARLARGESFAPDEIFNAKHREGMTQFFIVLGLVNMILGVAILLFFFPAIVMYYALMLSVIMVVVHGVKPLEALNLSYKATYGSKWAIFLTYLIIGIIIFVVNLIIGLIVAGLAALSTWLGVIFGFLFYVAFTVIIVAVMVGIFTQIYKSLVLENPAILTNLEDK